MTGTAGTWSDIDVAGPAGGSADEVEDGAQAVGCRCGAAVDEVVRAHLPLVRQVVLGIQATLPPSVEFEEAMSWGMDGLLDACRRYDPSRATRFRTYARIRIRGAILDALRSLDWMSRTARHRANELLEKSRRLEHRLGRRPSQEEIAAAMGLRLEDLHDLLGQAGAISLVSVEDVAFDAAGESLGHEDVCGGGVSDPLLLLLDRERRRELSAAIDRLPGKERALVPLYYGSDLTMKEVGARLGITESRVSQLHARALSRLRGMLGATPEPEPRTA